MEIVIKKANPNQVEVALEMLNSAAVWLKEKGSKQWEKWLDPSDLNKRSIQQGFEKGEFYFVYSKSNVLVGMYRLQTEDEANWGKNKDNAVYVHQLVTNRDYQGKNVGASILTSIERELQKKGIEFLRLDCLAESKGLCEYYEKNAFEPKGLKKREQDGLVYQQYEKDLKGS